MRENLNAFRRQSLPDDGLRPAAVAVVVTTDDDGVPCWLLTERSPHLRAHRGQLALPGGRVDTGEQPVDAALREVAEELGLELTADSVLGGLDDYATRSGYLIKPVVVWAGRDAPIAANPTEVARCFRVPLDLLEHPEAPRLVAIPESDRPVIQMPMGNGRFVNAPTAAVLYQFREVALHGRHTRVSHFEQPVWAWS